MKEKKMDFKQLTIQGIHFNISTDIFDQLYFADGPYKNCKGVTENDDTIGFSIDIVKKRFFKPFFKISELVDNAKEPSGIYTELPIMVRNDLENIESPGYFPTYSKLTPSQRYAYLKYLENPFSPDANLSYVYLLFYGLERNLFTEKYEDAINIIKKLMSIYKKDSFISHSITSLVYIALFRNDEQKILEYLNSNYYEYISEDLLYYCFFIYKKSIPIEYIIHKAYSYGFTNKLYIKKCPGYFQKTFSELYNKKYKKNEIFLNDFISKNEFSKYEYLTHSLFANSHLPRFTGKIPFFYEYKVNNILKILLEETHNQVKKDLAKNRNQILSQESGESIVNTCKHTTNTIKKEEPFDYENESLLLYDYEKSCDYNERHIALIKIIDFYYKHIDKDDKYFNLCLKYCNLNIEEMEKHVIDQKPIFLKEIDKMSIKHNPLPNSLRSWISKRVYNVDDRAYARLFDLALIHNDFEEASRILEKAREWSTNTNSFGIIKNNPKRYSNSLNIAKENYLKGQK